MAVTQVPPGRENVPHPEGVSPWPPRRRGESPFGSITVLLFSVTALLAALFGLVLYATDDDGGGSVAGGGTKTFDVTLSDLDIQPASIDVAAGDRVVLNVTNDGAMAHDVKLGGTTGSDMLDPGATATVDLGVITETSQAWCTVPGHKEAGMVLDINVSGSAPAAPSAPAAGGEAAADAAVIDASATPGPDWHAFDPTLQPAPGGTVHDVAFSMQETVIEVAPGVTQELWTFNGQYPGPTLRGRVGDVFNVTVTNDGKIGHSIDFHASKTPMDVDMRTLLPGESLVYQFSADFAGVWMYHCGTAPVLHHIGNGMAGGVIIDPPVLAPVDHEYLFVQSELYLGPEGGPGDLTKMIGEEFDAVVFNGYHSQYVHEPIRVEPGDRIRAYVLDIGPSENSSWHVVGTIFDTVYKEGTYLLQPGNVDRGGAQALDLQPAQGGFVEFTLDEQGKYAIVTHKFSNPGKGALGFFQAGEPTGAMGSH
ncbi:MAG TPA: multicopper oxidase domain-containing protein [Acidimicrobiales bacterium]|nr:multicopper oxidase domain-containing protein [Acidimicrobiales bacterium]